MLGKERIIIDTDTAGDDVTAILTALTHFQVEGVTIAGGNVSFEQEIENALYTIEMFSPDYYVPVHPGYQGPILNPLEVKHETVENVHGRDGMGDSFFAKAKQKAEKEHAVDFIIRTVKENPGEISLLAIAPLTNIAMALKKDPTIVKDVKHLYIMGGINNSLGNITPAAEYNFWVDPEAAKIVLHSGLEMTMVGWDMCVDYSVMYHDDIEEIRKMNTEIGNFYLDVNRVVLKANKEIHLIDGITHPDSLMVAIVADPSIMTKSNNYYVDIETVGEITRGYNSVDLTHQLGKKPNIKVCESVDRDKFRAALIHVLMK